MKFDSFRHAIALLLALALLSGCESMSKSDDEFVADEPPAQEEQDAAESSDTNSAPAEPEVSAEELAAQRAKEAAMKEQAALREVRTFYFDFDQYTVKPEARSPLAAHAAFLSANPSVKVVLEGHCDERGTKEYNIALGENRAKAVERFLKVNGVSDSQIEIVSYGEERPAATGHTEQAWAKNRRVYIEYK